ncbi:related to FAD-dependent oxidoreductase [Ramularia collo-cygni]|uniref:Related to FAD-dependent oxidoreductase n=1 Tax=Ramularia collo-cygni TaxID=112498 RepID=A0A2D3UL92_9PEZI|nr:related to FAD-dependent oxidoreductase [Ramularia collo-cygni]CZT14152.1 related to FAD-dependent oxidoreductase [Ramularia collo-cygni]
MEPSILIIGAGTFGTSTAYHLAQTYKDASKVTIIDRSPSPPKPAASIDANRIIRTDYPSKLYCDLACEAIHSWFWSLELVGWLMLDEKGSTLSDRIIETFLERGSTQAERLDLNKLDERWPLLRGTETAGFNSSYFNCEAGWCDAASATASFMSAAQKKGVKRVTGRVVELLLDTKAGKIRGARTEDGKEYLADKIVLATGAWTSMILSPIEDALNLPDKDRIERQVQATGIAAAYYRLSEEEVSQFTAANLPVIVYGGKGEVIPPSKSNRLLKISNSKRGIINTITTKSGSKISVPCSDESQYNVPAFIKRETEDIIASKVLPDFVRGKQPEYWRICWDAQTPDENFLMCRHPDEKLGNLYLAVGGSFHAYKFLPNAGKYMLNVLAGEGNGPEKDKAWGWKVEGEFKDEHQFGLLIEKTVSKKELRDLQAADCRSRL